MTYVLATTEKVVKWIKILEKETSLTAWVHFDKLDLNEVSQFSDKASAKEAALGAGLKSWRYVKLL